MMSECVGSMRHEHIKVDDYNRTALIEAGFGE